MLSRLYLLIVILMLAACGGSDEAAQDASDGVVLADVEYSLSGNAVGIVEPVIVDVNGQQFELSENGLFFVPFSFSSGDTFIVTVQSSADDFECSVSNGEVSFADQSISNVEVRCERALFQVSGTVVGLDAPIDLTLGSETITVAEDGAFSFSQLLRKGESYAVEIDPAYVGECRLSFASGTIEGVVTSLRLICIEDPDGVPMYSLRGKAVVTDGGTLSKVPDGLVLSAGGDKPDDIIDVLKREFVFSGFRPGFAYDVQILSEPAGHRCEVFSGAGEFNGDDIDGVRVFCKRIYTVSGEVTGLDGTVEIKLADQTLQLSSSSSNAPLPYSFPLAFESDADLLFEVTQQPQDQSCGLPGTITNPLPNGFTISDLNLICDYTAYRLGGSVSGLDGELELSVGGQTLTLQQDGAFSLPSRLPIGDNYSVSVVSEPLRQVCTVTPSRFSLNADQLSLLSVNCSSPKYELAGSVSGLEDGIIRVTASVESGSVITQAETLTITGTDQETEPFVFENDFPKGDLVTLSFEEGLPANLECTILNANIDILPNYFEPEIDCVYTAYKVGGVAAGHEGAITLSLGEQEVVVAAQPADEENVAFEFPNRVKLEDGEVLSVVVTSVPANHRCTVSGNAVSLVSNYFGLQIDCVVGASISGRITVPDGVIVDSDVNDIRIAEITNDTFSEAQPIGGYRAVHGFVSNSPSSIDVGRFNSEKDEDDIFLTRLEAGQVLILSGAAVEKDINLFDIELELFKEADSESETTIIPVSASTNVGTDERILITETARYYVRVRAQEGAGTYALEIRPTDTSSALTTSQTFLDGVNQGQALIALTSSDARVRTLAASLNGTLDHFDLTRAILLSLDEDLMSQLSDADLELDAVAPQGLNKLLTLRRIKELSMRADVDMIAPNFTRKLSRTSLDPLATEQWSHDRIGLFDAWDITIGEAVQPLDDVIVAVIDSGIQSAHEDFAGKLVEGYDFVEDAFLSQDGDGIDSDPEEVPNVLPSIYQWHGTKVAGVIAANAENGLGIAGVSWGAKIMPILAADQNASLNDDDIIQSILFAAGLPNNSGTIPSKAADVINMSFGSFNYNPLVQQVVDQALGQGIILVASGGNEGVELVEYPASYDGVISVSATNFQGSKTTYSSFNSFVDVTAPGGSLLTDLDNNGYADGVLTTTGAVEKYAPAEGTSFSAPIVSGVMALMKSLYPGLTAPQAEALLANGLLTDDLGEVGYDKFFGYGMINAEKSVLEAQRIAEELVADPNYDAFSDLVDLRLSTRFMVFRGTGSLRGDFSVSNILESRGDLVSVETDQPWLSVSRMDDSSNTSPSDGEQEQRKTYIYEVLVDTSDLLDTEYQAQIIVTDRVGNEHIIAVELLLAPVDGDSQLVPLNVLFYEGDSLVPAYQTSASYTGNGMWYYEQNRMLPGAYTVLAQSDIDNQGDVFNTGELAGFYLGLSSKAEQIDLGLEDRMDVDISAELYIDSD